MKKYILILAILPLLLQCKDEPPFDDLGGDGTLKGVAVIYDTLNGTVIPTPWKNMKIYLKKKDASSYLYAVTSSTLGQYNFSGIAPGQAYTIYTSADTGTIKYAGRIDYPSNFTGGQADTLKLYPDSANQNVLHLILQDSQGGRIPNVAAWVFNSPVLFNADTSVGRVFDMASNSFGVSNRFNIAPGTYYLRIKTRIGNLDLGGEARVDMPAAGIRTVVIPLKNGALNRNGVELNITDIFNTPVSNAQVYFYRSQAIFMADTIRYNNSLFSTTSNASGFAAAYLLEPATYYIRTIKPINADTLIDQKNILVGATVSPLSMTLK